MTAWTNFVTKIFKNGRKKDKNFQLGDAMKEASAKYKKGGDGETKTEPEPEPPIVPPEPEPMQGSPLKTGGKKQKTKKSKKGGKKQKTKKNYSKRH